MVDESAVETFGLCMVLDLQDDLVARETYEWKINHREVDTK